MAAWNNSTFALFDACKRLYYLKDIEGIVPAHPEVLPGFTNREEGTLWHAVMAQHYGASLPGFPVHPGGVLGPLDDAFKLAMARDRLFAEDITALQERHTWWKRLYDAYASRYRETDCDWEILAVEHRFISVLGDECYHCGEPYHEDMRRGTRLVKVCDYCGVEVDYIVGQSDLITREQGVLRVTDHKTTARSVGEWKLASYTEDPQFTHYSYGVSRTTGEYIGTARANIVAKLKLVDERGNPFHRNNEIVRGQEDFDAFVHERRDMIRQIRQRTHELKAETAWPRSPGACRRFGLCDYYGVCWPTRSDWSTLPWDLEDSFTQRPPNYVDDYEQLIQEDVR